MSEQSLRVLLIGDETSVLDRLAEYLRREHDHEVDMAANGEEALARIAAEHSGYDVVLIDDVLMPGSNRDPEPHGINLMVEIKTSYPAMEFIVCIRRRSRAGLEALRAGAYRYTYKPFDPDEIAILIEAAAEHRRLKGVAREKQILEHLVETSAAMLGERDLQDVLDTICRAACGLFDVDHSGLVLFFDSTYECGQVVAEYPPKGTRGREIPVRGVPAEERLIEFQESLVIPDVASELSLGPVLGILKEFDIQSILIVPVVFKGRTLGSFSLDAIGRVRAFTAEEIALCKIFAAQVAAAVENAQLFTATKQHADQLETVRQTTLAITSQLHRDTLLRTIIQQAVLLLKAKSGGIYEYYPERGELIVIADYGRPEDVLYRTLRVGEGMAGRLVQGEAPFMIVDDYNRWPGRAAIYADKRPFGAVIEVPLTWQERIIGVLYVDDEVGRKFTPQDAELLQLFADHATIALINAELGAVNIDKVRRLEKLAQASREIMGNLGDLSLDERLNLIARYMTEILDAEASAIFLVKRPGLLSLEASYGHREGHFEKGKELIIDSGPKTGLTGHIASKGKLFNAHGDKLTGHFSVRGEPSHTVSAQCYSLLALPLKKRSGREEELIGLLRADNKKGRNGWAGPTVGFTDEDESILKLFADAAVAAIEGAGLVTQLGEQKDYLDRLIASSPNGVIAIDRKGNVTAFSARAQEVLCYQPEEVLGKPVDMLYDDPKEPRRIGRLLYMAEDGKLAGYETFVRSKEGESIPIRLAATWLYDAHGKFIGSAGYFEDLRSIKGTELRLELLLKASNIVAQASNLTDGLQRLAEMMVMFLSISFCRIFLLDESKEHLVAKAVFPVARSSGQLDWRPGLGDRTAVAEWPSLAELLGEGGPTVLKMSNPRSQLVLTKWSRRLELKQGIQSLLVIPLRTRDGVVGLLDLGELRRWERAPFSKEKQDLAAAIADQTAVLIDRMRLFEITERHRQLLKGLDEALRQIRAKTEPRKLLQEIVRLAANLVGCTAGGLYTYHPHLAQVELSVTYGLPGELIGVRQSHDEGLAGRVARAGKTMVVRNYDDWPHREAILDPYHFKAVAGIPLKQAGDVEAVLFIADSTGLQHFMATDLEILERFATRASLALETSRLMTQEQRLFGQLALLQRISDYIQAAGDPDKIAHVVLTGVTAGYGLRFNRAALLLLDETREQLVGHMGIGYLVPREAWEAWDQHNRRGLENFKRYLDLLEQDALPLTPLGERVRRLRLPVHKELLDAFSRVIGEQHWRMVTQTDFADLPDAFTEAFQPASPFVVVPLMARNQVIGLLVADNKFTWSPITDEDVDLLLTFANTAAIAIDNARLYSETRAGRERLRSFYEASAALVSSRDPERVLRDTVERACAAANATGVSAILIDELGQARDLTTAGKDKATDVTDVARPNGLSMQVLRTGEPEVIEDTGKQLERVNPDMIRRGIGAGLCLPFSLEGTRIGVMWFHYDQPRHFSPSEIEAIQLYVNQAAIAYDSARRIKALSKARNAAHVVAQVTVLADLQSTLRLVVTGTQEALGCDAVTLYIYDRNKGRLIHPPIMIGVWYPEAATRSPNRLKYSFVSEMLKRDQMYLAEHVATDPLFKDRRFVKEEQIKSCVAIPLKVGTETVGIMFVNYRSRHRLTGDEIMNIELFANQAAVAIHNAKLYEREQKRAEALKSLYEAGKALTGSLDLNEILNRLVQQACRLTGSREGQISFASIRVVEGTRATLMAAYPPEELTKTRSTIKEALDLRDGAPGRVGIMGRAIRLGTPQLVGDVTQDPDYLESHPQTHSELAVPIIMGSQVIGVINVEHPDYDAFDQEDQRALESLAAQAAIAVRNARLHKEIQDQLNELERTRGILAARTSVAWMGMVSSTWRHAIDGHALTIAEEIDALRLLLPSEALTAPLVAKLSKIGRMAKMILDKPITPPLSSEEDAVSVPVNSLLRERLNQLWKNDPYRSVHCQRNLWMDDKVTTRISPEWLRRVFDILIDNAVEAAICASTRQVTVTTRVADDWIAISVADTGGGIPEHIRANLFQKPITKSQGDKGLGMGLLLAQTIIQTYEGEIFVESSDSYGTTMVIRLPAERERSDDHE